jgi:hypothetical protein
LEGQARAAVPVPGGQFAWGMRRVRVELSDLLFVISSRVLASLCFDPFGPVILVARSLVDGPRGECRRSLRRERSASRA